MSTRSRTRRQFDADDTLSSNDKSGLEKEKESKPRTVRDQSEVERRKLCHCEEKAVEKIVMNPIVSNGNKLKWKVENVNELTDDGMDSDKFTFQGVDWKIHVYTTTRDSIKYLSVSLLYDGDNRKKKNWICEVRRVFKLLNQNENGEDWMREDVIHYAKTYIYGYSRFMEWSKLESGGYMKENSIVVEIELDFKYYDFSKSIPDYTDIILSVKGTMFHVNKGVLCSQSEYFYKMFVVEKRDEKELTIENVKVDDFRYFISSFCLFFDAVNDKNYEQLIKLAVQFKTPGLHRICEKFLITNKKLQIERKIEYADKYNYHELMRTCIDSIKTTAQIKKLQKSKEFENLKDTTKLAIMTRLLNLV